VALQEEVWGEGFSERVPMAILKVGQELGGVSAGAFDQEGRLDGFVFGLTGLDSDGSLLHWSDMLAVREGVQGQGLGLRLKAFQREAVLRLGVRRMAWTFDPLRARNAHLNLAKLGAVIREYRRDMYGQTDSRLHQGIGTDRFVALWFLDSERVEGRLARALRGVSGGRGHRGPVGGEPVPAALRPGVDPDTGLPCPTPPRLDLEEPRVAVSVPADIGSIMNEAPELAVSWRDATRTVFLHYLLRGYEIREIVRGAASQRHAVYHMERRHGADEERRAADDSEKGNWA
jgi:predicted GNAT superfamily acetyltransferase